MRATAFTTIRWLRMTNVKDCGINCLCSDELRKILLKLPINKYDEIQIESDINRIEKKYKICYDKNTNLK